MWCILGEKFDEDRGEWRSYKAGPGSFSKETMQYFLQFKERLPNYKNLSLQDVELEEEDRDVG